MKNNGGKQTSHPGTGSNTNNNNNNNNINKKTNNNISSDSNNSSNNSNSSTGNTDNTSNTSNPNNTAKNNNNNNNINNNNKTRLSALEFSISCVNKLTKQNDTIFKDIDKFSFDIWKYIEYDCVKNNPLLTLGMYIIIHAQYLQPIIQTSQKRVTAQDNSNNNNNNGQNHDTSIYIFPKNHQFDHKSGDEKKSNVNNGNILQIIDNTNQTKHGQERNFLSLEYCANFLQAIESTYEENPYHNRTHAADVTQFAHVLLTSLWNQKKLNSLECLAVLMAAAAHDAGHGGKNNDFLIKSKSKLLSEHNAPSVLENYHLHRTFDIINNNKYMEKFANIDAILSEDNSPSKNSQDSQNKSKNQNKNKNQKNKKNNGKNVDDESKIMENVSEENDCNFFQTFDAPEQIKMEKIMRFAILGTDMNTYHKSIRDELSNPKDKPQDVYTSGYSKEWKFAEKLFVGRAMLHMADISNPLRQFTVARLWANRILTEFFEQGDLMKEMKLPVSFGCDRDQIQSGPKNQNGFLNLFVLPLAELIVPLVPEVKDLIDNDNRKHWDNLEKQRIAQQQLKSTKQKNKSKHGKTLSDLFPKDIENIIIKDPQIQNGQNEQNEQNGQDGSIATAATATATTTAATAT